MCLPYKQDTCMKKCIQDISLSVEIVSLSFEHMYVMNL